MKVKVIRPFDCPTHKAPAGAIIDIDPMFAKVGIANGDLEPFQETATRKISKKRAVKKTPRKSAED